MTGAKVSDLFSENIEVLPMWVKQIAYRKMEQSVRAELTHFMSILNPNKLMQEICPAVTFKGRNVLKERKTSNLTGDYYIFLQSAMDGNNIFDIAVNNFWTLAHACRLLVKCVENEFVEGFYGDNNYAIAQFLAGQIRTGELLKRLGQLDVMQLKQAIEEQKYQKEIGHNVKIADIMIKFGFITQEDADILLSFKEDAEKRLTMGFGFTTIKFEENNDKHKQLIINLQREFKNLDQENRILKERLKKYLNI